LASSLNIVIHLFSIHLETQEISRKNKISRYYKISKLEYLTHEKNEDCRKS